MNLIKICPFALKITLSAQTMNIATENLGALISNPLTNLTPYVGNKITVIDSSAKSAVGWIGAAGAGENLDATILTNGDMETGNPPTGWSSATATLSGQADERTGGAGVQCLQLVGTSGAYAEAHRSATASTGALYKLSIWMKNIGSSWVSYGLSGILSYVSYSDTTWKNFTAYRTKEGVAWNPNVLHLRDGTDDSRFDDYLIQKVLTPSADGVTIVSARGGATQSWTSVESGFSPNSASFTVHITSY